MKTGWFLLSIIAACASDGVNEIAYLPSSDYWGKADGWSIDKERELPLQGVVLLEKYLMPGVGAVQAGGTQGTTGLPSVNTPGNITGSGNPTGNVNQTVSGLTGSGTGGANGANQAGPQVPPQGGTPQGNLPQGVPQGGLPQAGIPQGGIPQAGAQPVKEYEEKRYLIKGLTGRFGLGFQKRNYYSAGLRFPITPEILKPVGYRRLIKEKYYEPLPRIFYN